MKKTEEARYADPELLRDILARVLCGMKFRLDCGHHVTFGHVLGNNIIIYNGTTMKIICTNCGY